MLPKFAMVTLGLPHAPMTGAAAMPVLNHWKNCVPFAWQAPDDVDAGAFGGAGDSCEVVQPSPGVKGEPLMNDVRCR